MIAMGAIPALSTDVASKVFGDKLGKVVPLLHEIVDNFRTQGQMKLGVTPQSMGECAEQAIAVCAHINDAQAAGAKLRREDALPFERGTGVEVVGEACGGGVLVFAVVRLGDGGAAIAGALVVGRARDGRAGRAGGGRGRLRERGPWVGAEGLERRGRGLGRRGSGDGGGRGRRGRGEGGRWEGIDWGEEKRGCGQVRVGHSGFGL